MSDGTSSPDDGVRFISGTVGVRIAKLAGAHAEQAAVIAPARANAHAGLMQCMPPKCSPGAGVDGEPHSQDCDHATDLLEQLRALGFGGQG